MFWLGNLVPLSPVLEYYHIITLSYHIIESSSYIQKIRLRVPC